jgi:hypothetical protein
MPPTSISRPAADEHAAYYASYIALVPPGDLLTLLRDQGAETQAVVERNPDKGDFAYAPGKWTVKEVIGHLADAERVFTYRAVRFARGDATDLPGFDENAYVAGGHFGERSLADLLAEYAAIRASTLALASGLSGEALLRRGTANHNPVSVRALLYICAGHERHHVGLLRDRYSLT